MYEPYKNFIQKRLTIVDKEQQEVPFILNPIQNSFIEQASGKDIILKARQQGFSSMILAMFAVDFLMRPNTQSVVVADNSDNAIVLLERVKYFLRRYCELKGLPFDDKKEGLLRYNSKYQLANRFNNATYTIGTAQKHDFGRSRTLTNLHLSEAAFYPNLPKLLAGAGSALVPTGRLIIETTANGFNQFKTLWDDATLGHSAYKPLFFKASDFYSPEFLASEKKRLGRLFPQEYPETPEEAFLTSGETFFAKEALQWYLSQTREPLGTGVVKTGIVQ